MVVVGTSTGGPKALTELFRGFSVLKDTAICIVQHMPPRFTANLARRLNDISSWDVREASHAETLCSDCVYVAPGGYQTTLYKDDCFRWSVMKEGPVNGHEPSVDALFHSVAQTWERNVIGVIMTGMGRDGASGIKAIQNRGGYTIAESETTCVVYGMPKAAIQIGAIEECVDLHGIRLAIERAWLRFQE